MNKANTKVYCISERYEQLIFNRKFLGIRFLKITVLEMDGLPLADLIYCRALKTWICKLSASFKSQKTVTDDDFLQGNFEQNFNHLFRTTSKEQLTKPINKEQRFTPPSPGDSKGEKLRRPSKPLF